MAGGSQGFASVKQIKSEILHQRKEKISACEDNPGGFSQKSESKVSPGRERESL